MLFVPSSKINPMFSSKMQLWIHLAVVFIILNSLGFPGSFKRVFGSSFGTLIEYTSFLLQILIMFLTSGDSIMDIKLVNLKVKFQYCYVFMIALFLPSMVVSSMKSAQLVTGVRVTVTAFFALWLCEHYSVGELLTLVLDAQILYVLACIAFAVLFKSYDVRDAAREGVFLGIAGTKNSMAGELGLGVVMQVLLLNEIRENKDPVTIPFLGFLALQMVLLLASDGTGSLVNALALAVYILFMPGLKKVRLPLGYIYIIGSIGFLIMALTVLPIFEPILTAMGKDATLTGRTLLWNQIIFVMSNNHTFLGYGYGTFWKDERAVALVHAGFAEDSFFGTMTAGSHNMLLELWCNDGLLGMAVFFYAMIMNFSTVSQISASRYTYCSSYLIFYMIRGWTERGWPTYEYNLLFLFVMFGMAVVELDPSVLLERKKKKQKAEKERVSARALRHRQNPRRRGKA